MDWSGLGIAVLSSFGQTVTVTVGGVDTPLTAAFLAPHRGANLAGVPVDRPEPLLLAKLADWEVTDADNGDTVTIGEDVYTVVNTQTDDAGLVTVTLRKYAA